MNYAHIKLWRNGHDTEGQTMPTTYSRYADNRHSRTVRVRVTLSRPWPGSETQLQYGAELQQEWTLYGERLSVINGQPWRAVPPPTDPQIPWGSIVRIDEALQD